MGARHKIKLPSLGETVESVVVVEWHVSEGEEVKADAPLFTVETDKVDTEVPAPHSPGTVSEILVPAGADVRRSAIQSASSRNERSIHSHD